MRLGAGFIIGLSALVVGSLVGKPAFSQSSLTIDPFPLEEGGTNVVSQPDMSGQKVSERIHDQVRRGSDEAVVAAPKMMDEQQKKASIAVYNAGDQVTEASVQARQQLAEPRAPHALPDPVAPPAMMAAPEVVMMPAPAPAVPVSSAPMSVTSADMASMPEPSMPFAQPVQAATGNDRPGLVKIPVPDWVQFKFRSAAQGESVQDVLSDWSQRERVNLIWRSERDFPVLAPISGDSSYEVSVRSLLDQYQDSPERPVASLHIDTQTGARTLLVAMERNG